MGSWKGKHCRCRSAETLMLWLVRAASHEGGGEGNHENIVNGAELDMPMVS